jgi:diguanylate cyclase (GGDEF)-like protein
VSLYIVGIASSQVAAHVGVFPVANMRVFEMLGVFALIGLGCWLLGRERFGHHGLVALSAGGTALIFIGIGLSGGSTSPLWVLYFLAVMFNGLYLRRRIAWLASLCVIVLSAMPALIAGDSRQLLLHVLLIAPIMIVLTDVAITLIRELHDAARVRIVAIVERSLHVQAKQWGDQLEAIHEVAQQLTRLTDVNAIAGTIIEQTHRVIPFDSARVYVRKNTELVPVAFQGTGDYAFETDDLLQVRVGEGITGWVAQHAQPLIVDDARADPRATVIPGTPAMEESMLLAPLVYDDAVVGVLVLVKLGHRQFFESDLRLLTILAGQAANAIANAHLLSATRQRADTDGLTGLLNHRAIYELLTLHLEQHKINREPLSVMLLDADEFKRVNDTYGHALGDMVLQQLAGVLRNVCRPHGLAARYGGDEFMLVLPGMEAAEADRVAQHICDLAARQITVVRNGSHNEIAMQLSAGVATYPADGMTAGDLASAADKRLYAAKAVSPLNMSG